MANKYSKRRTKQNALGNETEQEASFALTVEVRITCHRLALFLNSRASILKKSYSEVLRTKMSMPKALSFKS